MKSLILLLMLVSPAYANSSICQIFNYKQTNGGNRETQGSGTIVKRVDNTGYIITATHVVGNPGNVVMLAWTRGDRMYFTQGVVVAASDKDVAMVMGYIPDDAEVITTAAFNPTNAPFSLVGYRAGTLYESDAGNSKLNKDGTIQFTFPVIGGMSGGPVFDNQGRLVGIVSTSDRRFGTNAAWGNSLAEVLTLFKVTQ